MIIQNYANFFEVFTTTTVDLTKDLEEFSTKISY